MEFLPSIFSIIKGLVGHPSDLPILSPTSTVNPIALKGVSVKLDETRFREPPTGEVYIYLVPWPYQSHCRAHRGSVTQELFIDDSDLKGDPDLLSEGILQLLTLLGVQILRRGGNSCVGTSMSMDPWATRKQVEGVRLEVSGMAAQLETVERWTSGSSRAVV